MSTVDPKSLREDGVVISGRMGNLALEASGVAAPENDRSEAVSQDSSGPPKTLSPAEALRARLAGFQLELLVGQFFSARNKQAFGECNSLFRGIPSDWHKTTDRKSVV